MIIKKSNRIRDVTNILHSWQNKKKGEKTMIRLNYEEFKLEIKEAIEDKENGIEVTIIPVTKSNYSYEGMQIREKDSNIAPVLNIKEMYNSYQDEGMDIDTFKKLTKSFVEGELKRRLDIDYAEITDYDKVRYKLELILVKEERLKYLVKEKVLTKRIMGMIAAVRINLGNGMSITVKEAMLKKWDISTHGIFNQAYENAKYNRDFTVMGITEVLTKSMNKELPDDIMYVVSNKEKVYGANAILSMDAQEILLNKIGDKLFIIPSSIHEVLVIPYTEGKEKELLDMIDEVNTYQVKDEEILSYSLYILTRDEEGFITVSEIKPGDTEATASMLLE